MTEYKSSYVSQQNHGSAVVVENAIRHGRTSVVEVEFSDGAGPKRLPNGQTPLAYLYQVSDSLSSAQIIRIRAAIEANEIARVYSNVTFSYSIKDPTIPAQTTVVRDLFEQNRVWKGSDVARMLREGNVANLTWLHVGLPSGQIIMAIFREIGSKDILDFAARSFQFVLPVALGDQSLKQREYGYFCGSDLSPQNSFIVFPCLTLATQAEMQQSRDKHQIATEALGNLWGTRTQDRQFSECNFQPDRTLDESYYSSLSASIAAHLNTDQVVSHELQRSAETTNVSLLPVLMVPQLWIWRADHCVVTAYSMAKPRDNAQSPKYDREYPLEIETNFPDLHIALLLAHHIEVFGEQTKSASSDTFPSPLDMFESAMLACMADGDKYLESHSSSTDKFREKELIHSIADIRNELIMIQEILREQNKILERFLSDAKKEFENARVRAAEKNKAELDRLVEPFRKQKPVKERVDISRCTGESDFEELNAEEHEALWGSPAQWLKVELARLRLDRYQARIKKIYRDAERIEKSIQDKLEVKRTHASIKDAHNSLILSMAVVGFTVITVIFAPLAFLTALFALDVEGFDKLKVTLPLKNGTVPADDDENAVRVYSGSKLAGICIVSEVVTVAITIGAIYISIYALKKWERIQDQPPSPKTRKASEVLKSPDTEPKDNAVRRETKKVHADLKV